MKAIIGDNLRALIAARDKNHKDACTRLGMKPTQLKRVLGGKHAVTMSTVERIAAAYDIAAYQLLIPGLDPKNPQVLRGYGPTENRVYQLMEAAMSAAKAEADEAKKGTQ